MNPKILTLTVIATLIILSAGCITNDQISEPEPEYIYIKSTPTIPAATPTPVYVAPKEPTYTKIWCMISLNLYIYDNNGNFLGSESFSNELIVPYTEYDWTDDGSTSIEDVVNAMGFPYNYIETVTEKSSYPANNKYIGSGKYIIHYDGGIVIMALVCTATRY